MPELDLDGLQDLLWTFARHRVITVAARTGLLLRLASDTATPEQAASDLDLDPYATGKVMRALHALGLLRTDGGGYRIVDGLAPHFREGPDDVMPFFDHSHAMYEAWGKNLERWLRGEGWATIFRNPEEIRRFGAAMRAVGTQTAKRVAPRLDLSGVRRMLDVGGGYGHFARVLCEAWPALRATVLDIPEVAEIASAELAGSGMEQRIEFVGGDYLETDYGSGLDLVLFANVLHQETVERAARMIHRGAAALAPGGRVVVVDFRIDDEQREHPIGTLFAINMRSFGDTHAEPTIRGWLEDAGVGEVSRTNVDSYRWIIEGRLGP
jgi:SAM-dependent methyltransferase